MLPVKSLAISRPLTTMPQNLPKNTISGTNGIHNAILYNSHTPGQKGAIVIAQKAVSGSVSREHSVKAASQATFKVVTKVATSTVASVTSSFPKGVTVLNSTGGNLKFITGLSASSVTSQANGQPSVMLLPQHSNGVAQGYQLVTLTQPGPNTSVSNNQKLNAPSSSVSQLSEQLSSQKELASKPSSASNVQKCAVLKPNKSVIIGNLPVSAVGSTETSKGNASLHNLNTAGGIHLPVFNHGVQPQILTFQAQNSSSSVNQQQKSLSKPNERLNSHLQKSGPLSSPPPSGGRQSAGPIPRIYTPTQGSSPALLTELPYDRRTPVAGSSLLIQSSIPQLQGSRAFNPTGQFNHQPFTTDHSSLATLVGIRPNQAGDAHHTIRLQSYQGLPAQRLAMYPDTAIRHNYSTFPGSKYTSLTLCT